MPLYQYKCEKCGLDIEKLQKFSDDPLTTCPECSEETLKKVIGNTSFRIGGLGIHKPTAHWGDMDPSR